MLHHSLVLYHSLVLINAVLAQFRTHWICYFGPPRTNVSDQEGAVVSELVGRACDAYEMDRDLAGTDGHMRTSIVETRIGVVKIGFLKLYHQTVCSAQRLTLNAVRLARPILGTVHSEGWSEARARDRFSGARALWKEASLVQCQGLRMSQGECVYESFWRGLAEVIKPVRLQGMVIVQWREYSTLIPLRQC